MRLFVTSGICLLLLAVPANAQEPSSFDKALTELAACTTHPVQKCAAFSLVQAAVEKDKELLAQVVKKGGKPGTQAALRIMSRVGGHAGVLKGLLASEDDEVRIGAIGLVANTGVTELAPDIYLLAQRAREKGPERELLKAVYALGRLKHQEAAQLLLELTSSPALKLSRAAIEAVATMGAKGVLEKLMAMAGDATLPPRNRKAAIANLGRLRVPVATKLLLKLVEKEDTPVRRAALRALGDTGDRSIVPELVGLMKEADLLPALTESLARIGGEKASSMLYSMSQDEELGGKIRFAALCGAARTGSKRALEPLVKKLVSSTPATRNSAIEALGQLGDPAAVGPLFKRYRKAQGQEKELAHWAIKMASKEALETEDAIRSYLDKRKDPKK